MTSAVPKPTCESTTEKIEAEQQTVLSKHLPKPDGFGAPDPQLAEATAIAECAGKEIAMSFRNLAPRQRRNVLMVFRRQLFPRGKAGRKRSGAITAAYADWKEGMRGMQLYRKHIPGWERHNSWRRQAESRALLGAIHARNRRERKRGTCSIS